MVFAFLCHSVLSDPCRVLFSTVFGREPAKHGEVGIHRNTSVVCSQPHTSCKCGVVQLDGHTYSMFAHFQSCVLTENCVICTLHACKYFNGGLMERPCVQQLHQSHNISHPCSIHFPPPPSSLHMHTIVPYIPQP